MKIAPLLLSSLLFVSLGEARAKPREVWVSSSTYGDPTALLVALKHALDAHPGTQSFHFDWGLASPHAGNEGVLIYDKTRQSLWIRQINFSNVSDDEAKHPIYNVGNLSQQWRFSRVTPNRLRLLFRRYSRHEMESELAIQPTKFRFFRASLNLVVAAVWWAAPPYAGAKSG